MSTYVFTPETDSTQTDPEIALLNDGSLVGVWTDYGLEGGFNNGVYHVITTTSRTGLYMSTKRVAVESEGTQNSPEVAALKNGGYVVGWNSDGPSALTSKDDIYFASYLRFYDTYGTPQTTDLQITPERKNDSFIEDVATLADGSVVAIVARKTVGAIYDLVAYRYSAEGKQLGARTLARDVDEITNPLGYGNLHPGTKIAPTDDGGYGLVWFGYENTRSGLEGRRVYSQTFTANGVAKDERHTISVDTRKSLDDALDQQFPNITALSTGGFAAAWTRDMDDDNLDDTDVYFRILDADGKGLGAPARVNTDLVDRQKLHDVVDLGAGYSLVTYFSQQPTTAFEDDAFSLRGRIYDRDGKAVTAAFTLESEMREMSGGNAVLLPEGELVATWDAEYTEDYASDVLAGTFELPRLTRKGSSAADQIHGSGIRDEISGRGGSDKLYGQRGDDRIFGGDGGDRIYGGGGDDRASGGEGVDRVYGGSGSDSVYGGGGGDRLYGGARSDALYGGGGNDLMTGGAGADRFVIATGWGRDRIADFTPGSDRLDLRGTGFDSLSEVKASATVYGGDTLIRGGGGASIRLEGVLVSELDGGDFLF